MKKFIIAILALVSQISVFAQTEAIMPSIIAFPSRQYMYKHGYGKENTTNGKTSFAADYDKAFLDDPYLKTALSTVSAALKERGCDIQMLEATMRDLGEQAALDMANDVELRIEDLILESARPDIVLEVEFYVSSTLGPKKGWTVKVDAVDAYTNDQVASVSAIVDPTSDVPDLVLKKVMAGQIEAFSSQLSSYFQDLHDRGRKVSLVFSARGIDMEEDEINGDPIQDYLEDWVKARALNHNSRVMGAATATRMRFIVRIPFFDAEGLPMDTKTWSRKLRGDLKGLGVKATLKNRGLGRVEVLLGEQ